VGEDHRAVALDMLVEAQAKANFGQHTSKRGLADLKRITPHVVAVQFDQVECVDEDTVVVAVATDEIERGNAVVIAPLPRSGERRAGAKRIQKPG